MNEIEKAKPESSKNSGKTMKTVGFHIRSCLSDSTAHGVPNLVKPGRSLIAKIFWVICFLLAAVLFLIHSFTLLVQYLNSPTKMSISTDTKFIAPEIYICNRMPFSMGNVEDPDNYNTTEFRRLKEIIDLNVYTYSEQLFQNFSLNTLYHTFGRRNFSEFYRKLQILSHGRDFEAPGESVFEIVANNRHLSCYRMTSLYRNTLFGGVNDQIDTFLYSDSVAFVKPRNMVNTKIRFETKLRPLASMKFTNLDNPATVGFVLYIVAPGEYPHPDSFSIEATAGFHAHIKLKMSTFSLLNKPDKPCNELNKTVKYYNFINPSKPIIMKAGQWDCVYQKYHELALKECNCTHHIYPMTDELVRRGGLVYCHHYLSPQTESCLDNKGINNKLQDMFQECSSQSPCKKLKYQAYVEESLINIEELTQYDLHFEGQHNKPVYKEIYNRLMNIRNESALNVIKIKESFHKIRIQRGEIMSSHWKEDYTYVLRNFLSDVGGIVGFYMGISLITFCEIFGLCLSCITERRMSKAEAGSNIEMTNA